ncbi:MAG TPA: UPF0182 family protein [Chloroflexia bacterium]|nr:UPF0182 family protein [Chloroflexia bacterium]
MSRRPPNPPDPTPPPDPGGRRRPASLRDEYEERFVRGRGQPPPPRRPTAPAASRLPGGCLILVAVVVLLFILGPILLELSVDWQWFGSLGLQSVYGTRLTAAIGVFAAGLVVAALFFAINWLIARRIAVPRDLFPGQQLDISQRVLGLGIGVAVVIVSLFMGFIAAGEWTTALNYFNHTAFGATDPIFHQDIGFYVFELPFYDFLRGWATALVVLAAIGVGAIYATRPTLFTAGGRFTPDPHVVAHISVLAVAFLLLTGVGYWFRSYELLFSTHDALYGASYTDVNARLLAFRILLVVTIAIALLLLINLRVRALIPLAAAVGVWLLAQLVVGGLYPNAVQSFSVKPAELDKERPYILNNIAATRAAFGLDTFRESPTDASTRLTRADVESNRNLVDSIRLWDYRPLLQTYSQLQSLRPYFVFHGVDLDRYPLAGGEAQVMISAREINTDGLAETARTWLNQHLVYTHGYGVVASPVNQIESGGQPHFIVRDFPVVSEDPALKVTVPQIYYGEAEENYAVVNTNAEEFDYPAGDHDIMTKYQGSGGVAIGSFLNRLQLAAYFGDFTLLISDLIQDDSRVLFHRQIGDMVQRVAPFLSYDADPYIVIADGKLYWIQDAYTTSERYPNSTPLDTDYGTVNYIRNSVKVVVDAYNGSMSFYVVDPKDPVITTYRRIFPDLFKDASQMPASLQAHVRYPEGMFNIQARTYDTFHMTDPQVFYNKGDAWRVPFGNQTDTSAPLEAYYTMMRLPGETTNEFMLMVPFTPASKQNMIAWMAGRGDAPDYGRVDVIRFPSSTTVFGPQQVDATINQDTQVSSQISLWNQGGSQVVRGNLLVIPIASSVLYVQPLFLQATSSPLPELKRVIAAAGGQVGMGEDLNAALDAMFGSRAAPPPVGPGTGGTPTAGNTPFPTLPAGGPSPTAGACVGDAASLSADALDHYQRAQDALKVQDWATYGREQALVEADLRCLQQVTR